VVAIFYPEEFMPSVFLRAVLCTAVATVSLGALAAAPAPAVAPSVAPTASPTVTPEARSMDVLRAFDKLCNAPKLTFTILAERAKATGMQAVTEATPAPPAGTRAGRWGGGMPSGNFVLLVDELRNVKGVTTSCAVAAEVGDVDIFRATAAKTMNLRAGVKPDISTDGGRTFDFGIVRPPSTRITVRDFKPKGLKRILVSVSTLAPAAR
jgi:hypothetical protein